MATKEKQSKTEPRGDHEIMSGLDGKAPDLTLLRHGTLL